MCLARLQCHNSRGFTLIELMTTIAVAAVLLVIAAPSFIKFQQNSQLTSGANALVAALSAARSEAMGRQLPVIVEPVNTGDWTRGWRIYVDVNKNNSYDAGVDTLLNTEQPLAAGMAVDIDTTQLHGGRIVFSQSGFAIDGTSGGGATGAPVQTQAVEFNNANATAKRMVILNSAGRIRVCDPNAGSNPSNCTPGDNGL